MAQEPKLTKPSVTARDINAALAVKYGRPEWCIFYEVAAGTGVHAHRHADAVAMSIWPSRGYLIHGFEVKVSRSDFMAEMKDPSKADDVGKYCDFWWLATPAGLVKPEEIPPTWGLMELTGSGLRVKVQAPKREPVDMGRGFAAAMIRRAGDMESAAMLERCDKLNAARDAQMHAEIDRRLKDIREKLAKRDEWAREFEAAFGMKPTQWENPADFAAKIKAAEKLAGSYGQLQRVAESAKALAKTISEIEGPSE